MAETKQFPIIKGRQLAYDPNDQELRKKIMEMVNDGCRKHMILKKLGVTEYFLNKVMKENQLKIPKAPARQKKTVEVSC